MGSSVLIDYLWNHWTEAPNATTDRIRIFNTLGTITDIVKTGILAKSTAYSETDLINPVEVPRFGSRYRLLRTG